MFSTSTAKNILSLENEIKPNQQRENDLEKEIKDLEQDKEILTNKIPTIESEIQSLLTLYPEIHLGRCDKPGVLSYYNIIRTDLINYSAQKTLIMSQLHQMNIRLRGISGKKLYICQLSIKK